MVHGISGLETRTAAAATARSERQQTATRCGISWHTPQFALDGDKETLAVGSSPSPQTPSSARTETLAADPPAEGPVAPPTAEALFGQQPWLANPTESLPDGGVLSLNPWWFATPQTAARVAAMLGGVVVEKNDFTAAGSPVQQQQPNQMVQLPDGRLINAGIVASLYTHGFPQSFIDQVVDVPANLAALEKIV